MVSHGEKTVHCYIQMHLDKIINPSRRRKLAGTYDPSPGPRMSHRRQQPASAVQTSQNSRSVAATMSRCDTSVGLVIAQPLPLTPTQEPPERFAQLPGVGIIAAAVGFWNVARPPLHRLPCS